MTRCGKPCVAVQGWTGWQSERMVVERSSFSVEDRSITDSVALSDQMSQWVQPAGHILSLDGVAPRLLDVLPISI
jgi:hypothetical protein